MVWKDPAITDFRARGTIMGPAGLTAVFGMGTGGAPRVSSPERLGLAVRRVRASGIGNDPELVSRPQKTKSATDDEEQAEISKATNLADRS